MNNTELVTSISIENSTSQSNETINNGNKVISIDDPFIKGILSLYTGFNEIISARPELLKAIKLHDNRASILKKENY